MKLIQRTGEAKFTVSTPGVTGQDLELDLNPIINEKTIIGKVFLSDLQT